VTTANISSFTELLTKDPLLYTLTSRASTLVQELVFTLITLACQ